VVPPAEKELKLTEGNDISEDIVGVRNDEGELEGGEVAARGAGGRGGAGLMAKFDDCRLFQRRKSFNDSHLASYK